MAMAVWLPLPSCTVVATSEVGSRSKYCVAADEVPYPVVSATKAPLENW